MPTEIRITASIPCAEDHMSQAQILVGLDGDRASFEMAIKKITGHDVKIDMRPVRGKAPKEVAKVPEQMSNGAVSAKASAVSRDGTAG
jgi:hypothetical protein